MLLSNFFNKISEQFIFLLNKTTYKNKNKNFFIFKLKGNKLFYLKKKNKIKKIEKSYYCFFYKKIKKINIHYISFFFNLYNKYNIKFNIKRLIPTIKRYKQQKLISLFNIKLNEKKGMFGLRLYRLRLGKRKKKQLKRNRLPKLRFLRITAFKRRNLGLKLKKKKRYLVKFLKLVYIKLKRILFLKTPKALKLLRNYKKKLKKTKKKNKLKKSNKVINLHKKYKYLKFYKKLLIDVYKS